MKKLYTTPKVFDCQRGMSPDVKAAFFRVMQNRNTGNDCYVTWEIADSIYDVDEGIDEQLVDKWLIENGAKGPADADSSGETVLIKHWW